MFNKSEMFNITHQLLITSGVSVLNSRRTAEDTARHFVGLPHDTRQHNHTVHTTHCLTFTSDKTHQIRTLCNSLYAVYEWNYSAGIAQLCKSVFPDNSKKHTHCIWAANGEVM